MRRWGPSVYTRARWRPDAWEAEQIETMHRKLRTRPHVLLGDRLDTLEASNALMFTGLNLHYLEHLMAGRLDVWAAAAHAAIDLMASPDERPAPRNPPTEDEPCAG